MEKTEYEIDNWAWIKGTNERIKVHITEIVSQECPGGCQFWYKGRVFMKSAMSDNFLPASVAGAKFESFLGIELEKI